MPKKTTFEINSGLEVFKVTDWTRQKLPVMLSGSRDKKHYFLLFVLVFMKPLIFNQWQDSHGMYDGAKGIAAGAIMVFAGTILTLMGL